MDDFNSEMPKLKHNESGAIIEINQTPVCTIKVFLNSFSNLSYTFLVFNRKGTVLQLGYPKWSYFKGSLYVGEGWGSVAIKRQG